MTLDSAEFADRMVEKSTQRGRQMVEKIYDTGEKRTLEETRAMCENFMWTEFHLGVLPPSRQIAYIYENEESFADDLDILIGLADMIRDEIKHSKLFSRRVEELGGNPNLLSYDPPEEALFLFERTIDFDHPVGLAASLQCSGEPTLAVIYDTIIGNDLVDQRTKDVMYQAKVDEGNHINVGKKIVAKYATDEETQEYVEEVIDQKFEALYEFHGIQMEPIEA